MPSGRTTAEGRERLEGHRGHGAGRRGVSERHSRPGADGGRAGPAGPPLPVLPSGKRPSRVPLRDPRVLPSSFSVQGVPCWSGWAGCWDSWPALLSDHTPGFQETCEEFIHCTEHMGQMGMWTFLLVYQLSCKSPLTAKAPKIIATVQHTAVTSQHPRIAWPLGTLGLQPSGAPPLLAESEGSGEASAGQRQAISACCRASWGPRTGRRCGITDFADIPWSWDTVTVPWGLWRTCVSPLGESRWQLPPWAEGCSSHSGCLAHPAPQCGCLDGRTTLGGACRAIGLCKSVTVLTCTPLCCTGEQGDAARR